MKTKNITVKIDAESYNKARIRGAQKGTSVSVMVRDFLASLEDDSTAPQAECIATLDGIYRMADARNASNEVRFF